MTERRFHYDYKTGRMKDTQSKSQATKDMRILETIINDACYSYEKKIEELEIRIERNMKSNMALLSYIEDVLGCAKDCRFYSHKELVKIISCIRETIKRNVR